MQGKARYIFPFFLSGIMAFLMTGFVTWLNLGLPPDFFSRWMKAWLIAWPLAYLSALIAAPFAQRATAIILARMEGPKA
jgi:predicted PurR-regulated permease PerM